jgi:hypothetical protein
LATHFRRSGCNARAAQEYYSFNRSMDIEIDDEHEVHETADFEMHDASIVIEGEILT